jgi:hypothetical protein
MPGVGKTTAARTFARRHDLRLYSVDSYTYAHAALLPPETRSLDELWVDPTPAGLADRFEAHARERFALVAHELELLPDDAPVLAEGPHLLPERVAPHATGETAIFVAAAAALQRRLVIERGSAVYARTRDPERARENRLRRDALLAERLRVEAAVHGLPVREVTHPTEVEPLLEEHFREALSGWLAQPDHGDVGARRRDDNDARLAQWRAHVSFAPEAADGIVELSCECDRSGCTSSVVVGLVEAEEARVSGKRFEGHRPSGGAVRIL